MTTSMTGILARLRPRAGADDGFAMVVVLGMASVMTALMSAGLLYVINTTHGASADENLNAKAYNAAIAGVNDYVARMNNNPGYCTSTDSTNAALSGWKAIDGTAGEAYRYQVISDCSISTGDSSDVFLKVSGVAGPTALASGTFPVVRTITAEIKRPGFKDYVFFTDKEEGDPGLAEYGLTSSQQTACRIYNWKASTSLGSGARPSSCQDLSFLAGDTINGKVHTNDVISISGNPTFQASITEGCPGTTSSDACYSSKYINAGSASPAFNGGVPQTGITLGFPATDSSVQTTAQAGGCVYTGPTRVVLLSDGYMSIASPDTPSTTACPIGSHVALPANGAMFVQNVPSTSSYYKTTCTAPWVTNSTTTGLSTNTGGTSYPLANDYVVTKNYDSCNNGNLWVEGTLKGVLDMGTENNIYITGNITYANGLTGSAATDGLGLVAQNSIAFYHPVGDTTTPAYCSRNGTNTGETQTQCATKKKLSGGTYVTCTTGTGCAAGSWIAASTVTGELCDCNTDLTVDAAMLSISHSVYLPWFNQSYTSDLGTLTINGSLAEYYRGPVKSGSSGYSKSYNYDKRLINIVLPGFPQVTSSYGSNNFVENAPAYGSPCYGGYITHASNSAC